MTPSGLWARALGLLIALAVLLALVLYRRTVTPTAIVPRFAPAAATPADRKPPHPETKANSRVIVATPPMPGTTPTAATSRANPTRAPFDLGTMQHPSATQTNADDERFVTNERFTPDDLQHPERYFEAAERARELNRAEERRDVLDFFIAYRAKLEADLEGVEKGSERRREILAVMARYDAAIARLRGLLAGETGTTSP